MVAQLGRTFVAKVDTTGAGAYATVGGVKAKSLKVNSEAVDVTNADSVNAWRELLGGAGIRSMECQVSGVFLDDTTANTVIALANAATIRNWQFTHPAIGTWQTAFQITNFEISGDHNGAVEYTATLTSSGDVTYTPV